MAGEAFGLRPGVPEVKAELAKLGQTLHPSASLGMYRKPGPHERVGVVLLDRVVEGVTPDYCTHGYISCVQCSHLCWMGDETAKALTAGGIYPLCLDCAPDVIPADAKFTEHLDDHLRADGPHT